MTPKVAIASENLAAGRAVVGFDVGVGQQVGLEVGALVEAAAAHRTLVGGLFHVQNLVHGQGPGLAEPLATLPALERLLLRVDVPATGTRVKPIRYQFYQPHIKPITLINKILSHERFIVFLT
jgi:hypothetical protein